MDIRKCMDSYVEWLKKEITFTKVGECYEVNVPFLDSDNDHLQFYVKQDGDEIYFADDGFSISSIEMAGYVITPDIRRKLQKILDPYGIQQNGRELIMKAPISQFAQKSHMFIQCLLSIINMRVILE